VALGAAAALAASEGAAEAERLGGLSRRFRDGLAARVEGVSLNGHSELRLPGNLNLRFAGVAALDLLAALPDLALSTGSACSSAEIEPSYVIKALGLDRDTANGAIRIGLGRFTTEVEIDRAVDRMADAVMRLRAR
jgi:cysteine desulfurase